MPDPINAVIVEGVARFALGEQLVLQPLFPAKYNWNIGVDLKYDAVIAVTPHKIMAWGSYGDVRWNLR